MIDIIGGDIVESEEIPMEIQVPDVFDYAKMKIRIDAMISDWEPDVKKAALRRKERYIELDVAKLRASGDIAADETIVPNRVIDTNIIREFPDYMGFLAQSHRLAIFDCNSIPGAPVEQLEDEFTEGLRYTGWYTEFSSYIDGAMLHGSDFIEVVFNVERPLHVGFEHLGYDRFFYNKKTKPCDSPFVLRRHELTLLQLDDFKRNYGFDPEQCALIEEANSTEQRKDDIVIVYRVYIKHEGAVHIAWYTQQSGASDWLKKPEKLRLGIQQPVEVTEIVVDPITGIGTPAVKVELVDADVQRYPVFPLVYKNDEDPCIANKKGRAFLDAPVQEATTSLTSSFVNGTARAAQTYASPENDVDESVELKQLDTQLMPGGIYSRKLNFWHQDYPDVSILSGLNYLNSSNAAQSGKQNFAVMNRKDSRKTAEELKQAEGETSRISSTGVANLSETMREMLAFAWKIVQSQAMQNKVKLLAMENGTNDIETLSRDYTIRPAGDVDFIERAELLQQMKQDWQVFQQTPLRDRFLLDLVSLAYPKKAKEYRKILEQGNVGKQLVAGLAGIVQASMTPDKIATLAPQEQQRLMMLKQQTEQFLAQP